MRLGSVENEYWVLAMHTGNVPMPLRSRVCIMRRADELNTTDVAP